MDGGVYGNEHELNVSHGYIERDFGNGYDSSGRSTPTPHVSVVPAGEEGWEKYMVGEQQRNHVMMVASKLVSDPFVTLFFFFLV